MTGVAGTRSSAAWRLIARPISRHRGTLAIGTFIGTSGRLATVTVPLVTAAAIDLGIGGHDQGALLAAIAAIVVLGLIEAGTWYGEIRTATVASERTGAELRDHLFGHLMSLDASFHDRTPAGRLIANATTDVEWIERVVYSVPFTISYVASAAAVAVVLVATGSHLALVIVLPLPLVILITWRYLARYHLRSAELQAARARLTEEAEQGIEGIRAVKGLGAEAAVTERFRERTLDVRGAALAEAALDARFEPLIDLLPGLGIAGAVLVGGQLAVSGDLTVGAFIALVTYATYIVTPVRMLGVRAAMLQQAHAAAERLVDVLETHSVLAGPTRPVEAPSAHGGLDVRFEQVWFGYGSDEPVLRGLDLALPSGSMTAIIGPTGSGKSTIAALLCRAYDPERGRVLVGGVDLRSIERGTLHRAVSLVPQQAFLFSDTLLANVTFGMPDARSAAIWSAIVTATAEDVVAGLPDGLRAEVGERGHALSGGQRQRFALARALIVDPGVLVLDDTSSAIDPPHEARLLQALRADLRNRTIILITHRETVARHADRVIVLGDGRVIASGTHDQLTRTSPQYRMILGLDSKDRVGR